MARRFFAHLNQFSGGRRFVQQFWRDQSVVEHHLGTAQAGQPFDCDQTGVTGPAADEVDNAVHQDRFLSSVSTSKRLAARTFTVNRSRRSGVGLSKYSASLYNVSKNDLSSGARLVNVSSVFGAINRS